jgi:hypothetical protein
MVRYAEVEHGLLQRPPSYRPILMHHLGQFILRPWAIGFMMGVSTRPQAWFPVLTKKRVQMAPLLACCEIGPRMLPELSPKEIDRVAAKHSADIAEIAITVMNFHKADRLRQKTDTSWRRPKMRHYVSATTNGNEACTRRPVLAGKGLFGPFDGLHGAALPTFCRSALSQRR